MVLIFVFVGMGQVRETIGVTLSVLCSNIRLYALSDHHHRHHSREGGKNDVNNQLMESCIKILREQSSQVLMNIQNASHCVSLESSRDSNAPDAYLNGDSQDDVKWMETVSVFRITAHGIFFKS
jgi:proteasome activator subunit 4